MTRRDNRKLRKLRQLGEQREKTSASRHENPSVPDCETTSLPVREAAAQPGSENPAAAMQRRPRSGARASLLPATVVVVAALLAYSNATPPVAIHDDSFFVPARHTLGGTSIARMFTEDMWSSTGTPAGVYRPLVVLSIAANGAMFGRDPVGYHASNVALHALASLVVFFLLVELLGAGAFWIAALAATIFATHPIHTEVVNSVINRSELLATMLVVIALAVLHRWHERKTVLAWVAVAILYFLALLCRESAVSLPALAVLMLWFVHADDAPTTRVRRLLPAAFLAIPLVEYFILRSFALASNVPLSSPALGVDAGQDIASRFLYSAAALREYARMMVWPHPLRVSYENFTGDAQVMTAIVHSLLLAAAVFLNRRAALITFAIAFFYIALMPSTRLFTSSGAALTIGDFVLLRPQSGLVLVGERVAYLPSVAATIACAAGFTQLATRIGMRAVVVGAAAVIAIASLVTFDRNREWHSAVELFAAEVKAAPENGDGWRLYVSALSNSGRFDEAAAACDSQLEQPARSAQLFNNCGVVYDRLQRDEPAIRAYSRAIEQGLVTVGHANLGRVYARMGRLAEAEAEFVAAAESENDPARRHYRNGLRLARFHADRKADARREFEAALALQPDYSAAKEALSRLGR